MFQGQPLIRFWDSLLYHYYILLLFIIFLKVIFVYLYIINNIYNIYIYIIYIYMICVWYVYGSRTWWTGKSEALQKKNPQELNDRFSGSEGRGTTSGKIWGTQKRTSQLYAIWAICHSWSLKISFHIVSVLSWLIFHGWHCWHLSCPPVIFTTTLAAVVEP